MSMMLATMLAEALETHGVPCRLDDDRVVVQDGRLTFHTQTTPKPMQGDRVLLQLDFGAEAPQLQGRIIWTSFAGLGADEKAAAGQGLVKFLIGPFHVLLAALAGHACAGGSEEWRIFTGRTAWDVCDSPLVTMGIADPRAVPLNPVVERLMTSFASAAEPVVHWGDIFFAFLNRELSTLDVRLDGQPWPEAAEALSNWDWAPPEDGYASGRYFFLAQPKRVTAE
jgi:hypothetical protein